MEQLQERELIPEKEQKLPKSKPLEKKRKIARKKKRKKLLRKIVISTMLLFAAVATIVLCVMLLNPTKEVSVVENPPIKEEEIVKQEPTIEYWKKEYEERYAAYRELNPDMSEEDVVWRVNANLDMPKYEYDIPVSGYDDPYIIVNKYYTVPSGYRPPDLKDFGGGLLLREETGNAYKKMREDGLKLGLNIRLVSAYRTVEYQQGLYNRYLANDSRENVDRYSARPGHSEHHTGMAMDLFGSKDGLRNFENTPEYPWVRDNCHKYGFIIRYLKETEEITGYESEPWHLRYVGVEVATEMKEKGIKSFEEYHAKYLQ